jgi:hypothetical protein
LRAHGWPVTTHDTTTAEPGTIAARIVSDIRTVLTKENPWCR